VALADVDGDGLNDIPMGGDGTIVMYVPGFPIEPAATPTRSFASLPGIVKMVTADFDLDGNIDIAVLGDVDPASGDSSDFSVGIHAGNGDGTFATREAFTAKGSLSDRRPSALGSFCGERRVHAAAGRLSRLCAITRREVVQRAAHRALPYGRRDPAVNGSRDPGRVGANTALIRPNVETGGATDDIGPVVQDLDEELQRLGAHVGDVAEDGLSRLRGDGRAPQRRGIHQGPEREKHHRRENRSSKHGQASFVRVSEYRQDRDGHDWLAAQSARCHEHFRLTLAWQGDVVDQGPLSRLGQGSLD
jgi:hypothetical protein